MKPEGDPSLFMIETETIALPVKPLIDGIKAKQKMTYYIRGNGKPINIAAVAEVNGLINLSVIVKDSNGKETPYKINSDEYKGASARRLPTINLPKGYSYVYITIENKTDKDKSVAIIVE